MVVYNNLVNLALKGLSESELDEFRKILSSIEKSLGEN